MSEDDIFKEYEGKLGELAKILSEEASSLQAKGDDTNALLKYAQLLRLAEKMEDAKVKASCQYNIASIQYKNGDVDNALVNFQSSAASYEIMGEYESALDSRYNAGTIQEQKGKYSNALKDYQQALVISKKTNKAIDIPPYK